MLQAGSGTKGPWSCRHPWPGVQDYALYLECCAELPMGKTLVSFDHTDLRSSLEGPHSEGCFDY